MKTFNKSKILRSSQVATALAALFAATVSIAQDARSSSTGSSTEKNQNSHSNKTQIKVTRATQFLGTDVIASDGRKVGDISDYVFDISSAPHLKYVIVVTDGFIGYGGDARAVPAEAITTQGDSARLQIDSNRFWNASVMPQNRIRFLSMQRNTDQLRGDFNLSQPDGSKKAQDSDTRSTNDRASNKTLVTFSDLQNADIKGRDGERLGRLVDTWLSLDQNRAPYLEIAARPPSPFEVRPVTRYAIPLRQLQANDDAFEYQLNITSAQLEAAEPISETAGVQMLQSGNIGEQILRVRVAQR